MVNDNTKKNGKKQTEVLESDIVEDSEVTNLQQQVSDLENQVKRVLADYQNLVKRTQEEKASWIQLSNKEVILRFLPILDTLQMAAKHSQDQTLNVCIQQFKDVLKAEGVERIQTEGKEFDPKTMEAISTTEGEEGTVVEEFRAGYFLHGTVLRPTQVTVGKGK